MLNGGKPDVIQALQKKRVVCIAAPLPFSITIFDKHDAPTYGASVLDLTSR
jgi:hypothetical protein